ncbi:MAG: lysine 2,3-aminomutase [Desulfocurvibacter africanus]
MTIYNPRQQEVSKRISSQANKAKWTDWRWHIRHTVRDIESFETLTGIRFEPEERAGYERTLEKFPLSITPYYLSLIDTADYANDPVFRQAFPSVRELDIGPHDMADPLHEDEDSPAPGITHRYPDRVLFHVSNLCAMYCRHCTRKRKVGDEGHIPSRAQMEQGLAYIRSAPRVRDVLLSGGDPLMLPDETLDWLLWSLRKIEHVEVVRIGSRMPVVLPYRVTDDLMSIIRKHHPVWLNTHFNHPREVTRSAREALAKLADAGIPLGNQSVLLAGVNDCPRIMRSLLHKLVRNRVRPYYLYQCDLSEGLTHFRTPVGKGIEIIESLVGHTSGFARPTYVIDAPGGGGKIPVTPNYVISWATNKVVLRNYEGVITTYAEPDCYTPTICDRDCASCDLQLKEQDAEEYAAVGIERLVSDWDDTQSLVPEGTARLDRRPGGDNAQEGSHDG